MASTCSMPAAMATNSASVPLKTARTRRIVSALSKRVDGKGTPGLERCSSGNDTRRSLLRPDGEVFDHATWHREASLQNRRFRVEFRAIFEPLLRARDSRCGRDSRLAAVAALGLIRRMRGSGQLALLSSVPMLLAACGSSSTPEWPKGNV